MLAAVLAAGIIVGCGSGEQGSTEIEATPVTIDSGPEQPEVAQTDDTSGASRIETDGSDPAEVADADPAPAAGGGAGADGDAGPGDQAAGGDDGQPAGPAQPTDDLDPADVPDDEPPPEGRADVEPPRDTLTDLATDTPTDLAGEIGDGLTLVWFWSPDTSTSEREAAVVQRFADTFTGAVEVVAVGSGGARPEADAFVTTTGLGVTTLWASGAAAADHYEVESLPESLLVDGSGNIIARWPGLPEEAFRFVERIT